MKIIDQIREKLYDDIFSLDDIDDLLKSYQYERIAEDDDEEENIEDGILKYTNGRSQLWVKYICNGDDYIVNEVTRSNKKRKKTETRPLQEQEIKTLMDYFRKAEEYQEFLIFILEILLARRIGDTLLLRWSDFYYEDGERKDTIDELIEDKTDKIVDIAISETVFKYLDYYCNKMNINPQDNLNDFVVPTDAKSKAKTKNELKIAINKHAASFRRRFKMAANICGIKGVSTHSLRKTFGHIVYTLNRFDPDCLFVEQTIFGHDSIETTKQYIGIMREKSRKYFNDMAVYLEEVDEGRTHSIDNIPVVALKTNDLRDIIYLAIKAGREDNRNEAEILNEFISQVELKRVG